MLSFRHAHLRTIACVMLTFMLCWLLPPKLPIINGACDLFCGHEAASSRSKTSPAARPTWHQLIIFEVDYNFEYKSHPELRANATPITLAGARPVRGQSAEERASVSSRNFNAWPSIVEGAHRSAAHEVS